MYEVNKDKIENPVTSVSKSNVCGGNGSGQVTDQGWADGFEKAAGGTSCPEVPNPPTTCPLHSTLPHPES